MLCVFSERGLCGFGKGGFSTGWVGVWVRGGVVVWSWDEEGVKRAINQDASSSCIEDASSIALSITKFGCLWRRCRPTSALPCSMTDTMDKGNYYLSYLHSFTDKRATRVPAMLDWQTVSTKLPWGPLLLLGGGFALAEGCEVNLLLILIILIINLNRKILQSELVCELYYGFDMNCLQPK